MAKENTIPTVNLMIDSRISGLQRKLDFAVLYIKNHYKEKLTLEQICTVIYLNKDYFIRAFKKQFGYTPYQYILALRMAEAIKEIKSSTKSISEISTTLGFTDRSHFHNAFFKKKDMY